MFGLVVCVFGVLIRVGEDSGFRDGEVRFVVWKFRRIRRRFFGVVLIFTWWIKYISS